MVQRAILSLSVLYSFTMQAPACTTMALVANGVPAVKDDHRIVASLRLSSIGTHPNCQGVVEAIS